MSYVFKKFAFYHSILSNTVADYQETCIAASESNFLHDPIEYDEEEYSRNEVFIPLILFIILT